MSQQRFFSKTPSDRLEALPQDLRELLLFKPYYTIELLEDIAQFREFSFQEKWNFLANIVGGKDALNSLLGQIIAKDLDHFYQGYKENLFSFLQIGEALNAPYKRAAASVACSSDGLRLLRKEVLQMDQLVEFSERSGHEARMLEFSLNKNFVYLLEEGELKINDIMTLPRKELKALVTELMEKQELII